MRLVLLLITAALLAAPTAALAGHPSNASSASVAAKKKPKPAKKSKRAKKTKQAKKGSSTSLEKREATGPIVALAPLTVGTLACEVPVTVAIGGFAIGDVVEIKCVLVGGVWTLRKIEREDAAPATVPAAPTSDEVEVKGSIVSLSPLQVGSTTCAVPAGMSLTGFAVGQLVELECKLVGGVLTVTKLKREDGDDDNEGDRSGPSTGSGDNGSSGGDGDNDRSESGGGNFGSGGDDD
jgi:uncharacterized membrane protein YgcG